MHPTELLQKLADICREAYIAERDRFERLCKKSKQKKIFAKYKSAVKWDGGIDARGVKHKPKWPKLAKFMLENGLDPRLTIRRRFDLALDAGGGVPPFPHQIGSDKYLELYRGEKDVDVTVDELAARLRSDCARGISVIRQWQFFHPDDPPDTAFKIAILSDAETFSPLFRYCLALSARLPELAEKFETAAILQYLQNSKAYDQAWDCIPDDFKEQARCAFAIASEGLNAKSDQAET